MKKIVLSLILMVGLIHNVEARYEKVWAGLAAAATWCAVTPLTSLCLNTQPTSMKIGYYLLGNDLASRYALGGIVAGTIGTLISVAAFKKVSRLLIK